MTDSFLIPHTKFLNLVLSAENPVKSNSYPNDIASIEYEELEFKLKSHG